MKIVLWYLVAINMVTFFVFGMDKSRAKRHKWRISEKILIILSLLGGALGGAVGMYLFHHKTKKPLFFILIPIFLLIQIFTIWYFMN